MRDNISWKAKWTINEFKDEDNEIANLLKNGLTIEQVKQVYPEAFIKEETIDFNVALNEGLQELINLLCGISGTAFDDTNAYIGVGDSDTVADATQTGLQAAVNKEYKAMDSTYPQRSSQTAVWRATYGSADANFAWNEFTVANGNSDAAVNLNRKVESKGTKVSGETWTISLEITFS